MVWWHAAAWGLAGGLAAGLASLMTAVIKAGFTWPWRHHHEQIGPRLFVFTGGLVLGGLVAAATHDSMSGPWPAFVMGVGALATVQGLVSGIEVSERAVTLPEIPAENSTRPKREEPHGGMQQEGVNDAGR